MKKITLVACLLYCHSAFAQKNTIEIGGSGYKFYQVLEQTNKSLNMASLRYTRAINNHVGIFAKATRAPINGWSLVYERYAYAPASVGKLTNRQQYHYFDIGIQYTVLTMGRHSLSAAVAASLARGTNEYLVKTSWSEPSPGVVIAEITYAETELKKESYPGGMLAARYDCKLWKNRLNLGAELAARYYTHNFPFQLNYGLHVGYSF